MINSNRRKQFEEESNNQRRISSLSFSELENNVKAPSLKTENGCRKIKVAHTNYLESLIIIFYHLIFIVMFLFLLTSLTPVEIASKGGSQIKI